MITSRWLRVWGPAVIQMVVIFAASSVPNLAALPGDVSDKTGHFVGYALLGGLLVRALAGAQWSGLRPQTALAAWVFSAAYGASDEWHQHFVPGRFMAFDDWVADALGAAAVVGVALAVAYTLRRKRREV